MPSEFAKCQGVTATEEVHVCMARVAAVGDEKH